MDWLFKADKKICDLRVAGILVNNGYILVQREKGGSEYAIPGGHVKIGETLADALTREYEEEMGLSISIRHLLWTEECFWDWNGISTHNISFYYLIELTDEWVTAAQNQFVCHKDNPKVEYGWVSIDKLKEIKIYPNFIKDEIHDLNCKQKHFITKA